MILQTARREVVTAHPDDSVKDTAALMAYYNVGCVVVVESDRPVGLVTDRDLALRVLVEGKPWRTPVAEVMTRNVRTIAESEGFDRAILLMRENGVRRLPVVDEQGRLRGIVTLDDMLEVLGRNLNELGHAVHGQQEPPKKAAAKRKIQV